MSHPDGLTCRTHLPPSIGRYVGYGRRDHGGRHCPALLRLRTGSARPPCGLRRAAAALEATYQQAGLTRLGRIEGSGFTVRIAQVQRSFRTRVEVPTRHSPDTYFLDADFFRTPPDWSRAKVPGRRTERVFFWSLSLPAYALASREQRDALSLWLNRGPADRRLRREALHAARIASIAINDAGVSTVFDGIVTNPDRLRPAIDVLRQLAAEDAA